MEAPGTHEACQVLRVDPSLCSCNWLCSSRSSILCLVKKPSLLWGLESATTKPAAKELGAGSLADVLQRGADEGGMSPRGATRVPWWLFHSANCLPGLGSGSRKEAGCQEAVVRPLQRQKCDHGVMSPAFCALPRCHQSTTSVAIAHTTCSAELTPSIQQTSSPQQIGIECPLGSTPSVLIHASVTRTSS